ncbi:MAG: alpha/beta hydrolase, partial [Anaerolineae bacterium]|nr:alpha/beta hydrolase [Anaerolineae bacterium]
MRIFAWIAGIGVALYGLLTLLLYLFQARLIFLPTSMIEATPDVMGLAYEPVRLTAADGVKLSGWFVPADGATLT